jgi:hypothetical protein
VTTVNAHGSAHVVAPIPMIGGLEAGAISVRLSGGSRRQRGAAT